MKSSRHIIGFFIICILIGSGIGFGFAWYRSGKSSDFFARLTPLLNLKKENIQKNNPEIRLEDSKKKPEPIRIIFAGDLMVDRGVEQSVVNNLGGDFNRLFDHVGDYFKNADAVFLNVEGPVTKIGKNVGSQYSFAMDEKIIPTLIANNVKMVSFANNHVGDRSLTGFTDTLNNFKKYGLSFSGAGDNKEGASGVKTILVNGLKIGFIACSDVGPDWLKATDTTPGQLLCSDPKLSEYIKSAHNSVDFLIFSAHWGVEYKPRTARQQTLAHMVIDNGADIVIGHHPHIVQETEYYKGKFIAYSLGNFIFDQYFSKETMRGLLVDVTFDTDNQQDIQLKIVELDSGNNKYQPKLIRDATEKDFLKTGSVAAQTCPAAKEADENKWLVAIGPDLDIGNYIPKNLLTMTNRITVQTTASCLTNETATALEKMIDDLESEKLKLIMTSGFRTRGTQDSLHTSSTTTQAAITDSTKYPSVAKPGHSEHQLGTAVDFKSGSDPAFSYDTFHQSKEYAWLKNNAHRYGFIQSYEQGKESITGYIAEAWHWRYVGIEHAAAIRDQGITMYEYLQNLNKKPE